MKSKEFKRLKNLWQARKLHTLHKQLVPSRRSMKAKANGTGEILKVSWISPQVPLERIFVNHR